MIDETTTNETPAEEITSPQTPAAKEEAAKPLSHHARRAQAFDKILAEQNAAKGEKPAEEPGETAAEEKQADDKKEPAKDAEKPKTPEEKADARAFAALARQKAELRETEARVATERQAAQAQVQQAQAAQKKAEEAEARAAKVFESPEAVFDQLAKMGISDMATLQKFAQGAWKRPAEVPPGEKPLTRAELEAELRKEAAAREGQARAGELYAAFDKSAFAEEREATPLVYSREEARKMGDAIATKLHALGKCPMKDGTVDVEAIADAVDEAAKEDPRYIAIQKKLGKTASTPAAGDKKAATQPGTSKAPQTTGPTTATKPLVLNGAAKLSHKDRIAETMRRAREGA
jgi:hypothetical protein